MSFKYDIGRLLIQLMSLALAPGFAWAGNAYATSAENWALSDVNAAAPLDRTAAMKSHPTATPWATVTTTSATGVIASLTGAAAAALNDCDMNRDAALNVADVQAAVAMILGLLPCTANVAGAGVCNVVVVQRVINAALGGTCVTDTGASHAVALSWTPSTSPNIAGYNIYRSTTSGGPYAKLNSSPVAVANYTDSTVQAGQNYYYVATAVSTAHKESAHSSEAAAAVPFP